jgi:hypothetical protein
MHLKLLEKNKNKPNPKAVYRHQQEISGQKLTKRRLKEQYKELMKQKVGSLKR